MTAHANNQRSAMRALPAPQQNGAGRVPQAPRAARDPVGWHPLCTNDDLAGMSKTPLTGGSEREASGMKDMTKITFGLRR